MRNMTYTHPDDNDYDDDSNNNNDDDDDDDDNDYDNNDDDDNESFLSAVESLENLEDEFDKQGVCLHNYCAREVYL